MAKDISIYKLSVKSLLESGKEKLFVIPEYQRPYVWSIEKIETLFEDIWEFASEHKDDDKKTYFLGTIVSYENEKDNTQEIIDGQQRITSLFLLLRAIYTKLYPDKDNSKEAKHLISQIEPAIWEIERLTGEVDYEKVLLKSEVINDDRNAILKTILQTGITEKNAKDIYSINYNRFLELYEEKSSNNPFMMYNFLDAVLNKAIIFPIVAGDEDSALTIFSTLNDRGEPLSDADIFKAKIYNNLENSKRSEFIEKWKDLSDSAEQANETIQKLFYYYMFYLRAIDNDTKTTTPGLKKYYTEEHLESLQDDSIITKLNKVLNLWKVVNNKDILKKEDWSNDNKILQILDILKDYPNEFWKYPVVIYYLKYNQEMNFKENFLHFLRRFYVFLLVKYIEKPTVNAVKGDIIKMNIEIMKTPKPTFPTSILDDEFKKELKEPHPNTIRMLLKSIAYLEQDELLPEKWEIEHIFPQKWHANYIFSEGISDSEKKQRIEQLGNKIPLEKKLNIEASNGYFGKKKIEYAKSKIEIAKKMSTLKKDDWEVDDILDRNIEISNNITTMLVEWVKNYETNKQEIERFTDKPSEDDIRIINEYRKKGWLDII